MPLTDAQINDRYKELLGREAGPEDLRLQRAHDSVAALDAVIKDSYEYRRRAGLPITITHDGRPITEDQGRALTRELYRKLVGYKFEAYESDVDDAGHADRMADEAFERLWANAQGIDGYRGDFGRVLKEHRAVALYRAELPPHAPAWD